MKVNPKEKREGDLVRKRNEELTRIYTNLAVSNASENKGHEIQDDDGTDKANCRTINSYREPKSFQSDVA